MSANRRTFIACLALAGVMTGMSFAAVPLYDLFCRVTGFDGTTQRADAAPEELGRHMTTVAFDASLNHDMPWEFRPMQTKMTLRNGETGLAWYRAVNLSDRAVTGTATFNVTPKKVGYYFVKIDCFCFTEQTLAPGASAEMPVQFFVDPDIETDPNTKEVRTITLSYTFFEADSGSGGDARRDQSMAAIGAAMRE